jgi:hypothetical protein
MRANLLLCVVVFAICAGSVYCEEENDFDKMPRIRISAGPLTVEAVRRHDVPWRIVNPSALPANIEDGTNVCFVAQFEANTKTGIKLVDCALTIRSDSENVLRVIKASRYGDYVAFFGEMKKNGAATEFVISEAIKQAGEIERFANRIAAVDRDASVANLSLEDKQRIAQSYIGIGREIVLTLEKTQFRLFVEADHLNARKAEAYEKGLKLTEQTVREDDAEAWYALSEQWNALGKNHSRQRACILKCLTIDPDHAAASRVARDKFELEKFEGKWMARDEIAEIRAKRAGDERTLQEIKLAKLQSLNARRELEAAERAPRLLKFEAELRDSDAARHSRTLEALGDAIQSAADPVFAQRAVDILANDNGSEVLASLDAARKSQLPEVRRQVLETLAWRAGTETGALTHLADAMVAEKDTATAKSGVEALVAIGNKPALGTLIAGLSNPEREIREEIISGLQIATKESLTTAQQWQDWWTKNK